MRERYQRIVEEQWDQIRRLYATFEDDQPIIVVELQAEQITAHSYEAFKAQMAPADQAMFEEQYAAAAANAKIIVFVRDDDAEQLVSFTVDPERADAAFEQRAPQRGRKARRRRKTRRRGAQHGYSEDREPDDWLVPYIGGQAIIHHGHEDPDDHSLCGPRIFCCAKAAGIHSTIRRLPGKAQSPERLVQSESLDRHGEANVKQLGFERC